MAVAQIGHELAHRWSTRTRAIVNGETIELRGPHDPWGMSGATHWPASVTHAGAVPVQPAGRSVHHGRRELEGQRRRHVHPARERDDESGVGVFVSRALSDGLPAGVEGAGLLHPAESAATSAARPKARTSSPADKMPITIQDVIAHNGPRVPSFENSPKALNTAIVAVTLHGRQPTRRDAHAARRHPTGVDRLLVQGHRRRLHACPPARGRGSVRCGRFNSSGSSARSRSRSASIRTTWMHWRRITGHAWPRSFTGWSGAFSCPSLSA